MATRGRILWVDDDPAINQAFRDEIEDLGFEVEVARSPDDMWNQLRRAHAPFDGVILDVLMPTGRSIDAEEADGGLRTGLVLAEQLRQRRPYRDTPIIIFTIRAANDVDEFGLEHQIRVLRKYDVSTEELAAAVEDAFGHSGDGP